MGLDMVDSHRSHGYDVRIIPVGEGPNLESSPGRNRFSNQAHRTWVRPDCNALDPSSSYLYSISSYARQVLQSIPFALGLIFAEMRTDISLIKPGENAQDEDPSHDATPREGLSKRIYRFTVISCIFFYSGVLFSYVPFVVGVIQSKELVVSAYLFGFVLFAPQICLTVEEFIDLRRSYNSHHIKQSAV
jgi:hypothetical protein